VFPVDLYLFSYQALTKSVGWLPLLLQWVTVCVDFRSPSAGSTISDLVFRASVSYPLRIIHVFGFSYGFEYFCSAHEEFVPRSNSKVAIGSGSYRIPWNINRVFVRAGCGGIFANVIPGTKKEKPRE